MKHIYLIQSLETGYYKIGISKHPNKRIKELQTGSPCELRLVQVFKSEHCITIEKTFHNMFSHLHMEGEWFNLSLEHEVMFIENCAIINKRIEYLKENGNVFI